MSETSLVATRQGFAEAERTVRDYVCGDCGGVLVVLWRGDRYAAVCSRWPQEHLHLKSHTQVQQDEIRARLERDPKLTRTLAVQGAQVPLTTRAIKELDNAKLMARIPDRYGASIEVSQPQKLQIAQMARLYGLDPMWDLMIYEGKPYITYDGRLRKLREHPDYRGHKVRPLARSEKEEWAYDPRDIVIQVDIDMGLRGLVTEWGVVRQSEIEGALVTQRANNSRKPAPVASHPQQIALKRAVARGSRMAVGIDLPTVIDASSRVIDVQEVGQPRERPPDAETIARKRFWATAHAAAPDGLGLDDADVHRLLGVETVNGYPGGWDQALSDLTERAAQDLAEQLGEAGWDVGDGGPASAQELTTPEPSGAAADLANPSPAAPAQTQTQTQTKPEQVTVRSALGQKLADLVQEAARLEVAYDDCRASFPAAKEEVIRKIERLEERVEARKAQLAAGPTPGPEQETF
jgi:hypothetical protein